LSLNFGRLFRASSLGVVVLYFGIDPGLDGCLVVLDFRGRLVGVHNLPTVKIGTKREFLVVDFARVVRGYVKEVGADNIRATVERHLPMPKQGISSQCKGAGIVGMLCGVLAGCNISFIQVHPRSWAKVMRDAPGTDKKGRSLLVASTRWPDLELKGSKAHNVADAALIAEYGRHQWDI
jgi:hypothetical protein|tara:strand:+ start:71 stop:607 length:537 start_codon:yes stop_codon:yes gene_type:complete